MELLWKALLAVQPLVGSVIISGTGLNQIDKTWYKNLNQSPLTPPPIVFPIVWTILYILLGLSAYFYYSAVVALKRPATFEKLFLIEYLPVYEIQLLLNYIWSIVFFYFKKPIISLVIVFLMIGLTVYLLWKSWTVNAIAFWVLIPYALWIAFATYLNFHIVLKNKNT